MKKEVLITILVIVLAVALVVGVIVANKLTPDVQEPTVAHDHDGDGVPDHGDDAHTDTEATVAHDHDGDGVPDHGDEAHTDNGTTDSGNTDSGNTGNGGTEGDVDISIDLEDVPGGNDTPGTTQPSTGTTEPAPETTQPSEGSNSGAVNGNEIDFDDLQNAGKN